jgi:carbonic anhydrase
MRKLFLVGPFFLLLTACVATRPPNLDSGMSGDQLWNTLMTGNQTYVDGKLTYDGLVIDREKTAPKQNPPVTILSCADSRVPPELAFHRTVGDLFVAREAGNIADEFTIASIEYAIANKWTRMIVVLGHEECGAVIAAIENPYPRPTPALGALIDRIRLSFPPGHCTDPKNRDCIDRSVALNTRHSAKYLIAASDVIREAVCGPTPTATLVTAHYDLVSGRVEKVPWGVGDGPCVPRSE